MYQTRHVLKLSTLVTPSTSASGKMRICRSVDFQTCKMRMVLLIFFADVTGKMRMQMQYFKLKEHMHFVEIFIVTITLCAIYVRHKTSHRHKSRVNGGTRPPEFVLGTTMMFVPQNSAHKVLNNAVCHLFILICTGYKVLHCI